MRLSDCYVCYRNFMFIIKTENGSNENNKTNVMLLLRTWNKIIHLHLLKIVMQATLMIFFYKHKWWVFYTLIKIININEIINY